ncbi:hypothetical protein FIBSPDRAFT_899114 [Athelia psychrophila]|uniref:Uncharacterized protein n=1 Tax=Athelia psychrophila TaxID=1759441 RepID=A0A166A3D7_9AGAM|nr:hypothetical protein FIBSPDRAFT_899114 [Fibularhizoctonia sp. CBS 109695]
MAAHWQNLNINHIFVGGPNTNLALAITHPNQYWSPVHSFISSTLTAAFECHIWESTGTTPLQKVVLDASTQRSPQAPISQTIHPTSNVLDHDIDFDSWAGFEKIKEVVFSAGTVHIGYMINLQITAFPQATNQKFLNVYPPGRKRTLIPSPYAVPVGPEAGDISNIGVCSNIHIMSKTSGDHSGSVDLPIAIKHLKWNNILSLSALVRCVTWRLMEGNWQQVLVTT